MKLRCSLLAFCLLLPVLSAFCLSEEEKQALPTLSKEKLIQIILVQDKASKTADEEFATLESLTEEEKKEIEAERQEIESDKKALTAEEERLETQTKLFLESLELDKKKEKANQTEKLWVGVSSFFTGAAISAILAGALF